MRQRIELSQKWRTLFREKKLALIKNPKEFIRLMEVENEFLKFFLTSHIQ